jgi:hypothetical protein
VPQVVVLVVVALVLVAVAEGLAGVVNLETPIIIPPSLVAQVLLGKGIMAVLERHVLLVEAVVQVVQGTMELPYLRLHLGPIQVVMVALDFRLHYRALQLFMLAVAVALLKLWVLTLLELAELVEEVTHLTPALVPQGQSTREVAVAVVALVALLDRAVAADLG